MASLVAAGCYIHAAYLFDPFTFKQDNVTQAEWRTYPSSLELDISLIDGNWKTVRITDRNEVRRLFELLKRAAPAEAVPDTPPHTAHFAITVRRSGTNGANGIADQFQGCLHDYIQIGNQAKVAIGPPLHQWMAAYVPEAQARPATIEGGGA